MSDDPHREDYELYALGLLEDPERSDLEDHLRRGCADCNAGMTRAREFTVLLASTVPVVDPPARLRRRVIALAGVKDRGWGWTALWVAATALSLYAAAYFYGREHSYAVEMARLRDDLRRNLIEANRLHEALAVLNEPEARQVVFGQGQPQPPRGRVFVSSRRGVLLLASNLPPAPAGKTYEMWIIPKGGKPVPAGLFQSEAGGTALHLLTRPVDVASTGAIAVTLEPAGGTPQPTSQPLIVAAL